MIFLCILYLCTYDDGCTMTIVVVIVRRIILKFTLRANYYQSMTATTMERMSAGDFMFIRA